MTKTTMAKSSHDSGHICVRDRREMHVKIRRGLQKCGHGTGKNALTFVFITQKIIHCV